MEASSSGGSNNTSGTVNMDSMRLYIRECDEVVTLLFSGKEAKENFWQLTCPCGKMDTFPLNKLPEVNTPHSCGNPKHWAVRYSEEPPDAI